MEKNNNLYSLSISFLMIFYFMFVLYDRPIYLLIGVVTMLFLISNRKQNKIVKKKVPQNNSIKNMILRKNKSNIF